MSCTENLSHLKAADFKKEIGGKEHFVDFLSIYKGYLVEFNLTPNPKIANQALTEDQIQMCIDFLTDVDFNAIQ